MQLRLAVIALCSTVAVELPAQQFTLTVSVRGESLEGGPVDWNDSRVLLLGRDGRLWDFAPRDAESFAKTSPRFQPLTHAELRGQLMREFGPRFDVSGAGQYVVVHPAGQRDQWAPRFDELYRSFVRYFSVRNIPPGRPSFPLVAVVLGSQEEFQNYARQFGDDIGSNVLGYYSTQTNRIVMYDLAASSNARGAWYDNATTLIHEAAHQVAFNTGIHNRYAPPPRWLAEGLGTMFEARGVWNSGVYGQLADRINRGRLAAFRRNLPSRQTGSLAEFISSDRLFRHDPDVAYGEAWALTLYLAENEPRKYQAYLQHTANRPPFSAYKSPQRLSEFQSVFGADLTMLETRMLRFVASLD